MDCRVIVGTVLMLAFAAAACGPPEDPGAVAPAPAPADAAREAIPPPPVDEGMLQTPFTAEQIRAEWAPGLSLTMRRRTPDEETLERWRVVSADQDGVEIEFTPVDCEGGEIGESMIRRSAWTELRDHASYPAATATRTREGRVTKLGDLEGWLYTVDDPDQGTVSELFFADTLPGAPVQMKVRQGDDVVIELEQIARQRPAQPTGS